MGCCDTASSVAPVSWSRICNDLREDTLVASTPLEGLKGTSWSDALDPELYNLTVDLEETVTLAPRQSERVAERAEKPDRHLRTIPDDPEGPDALVIQR